MKQNVGRVDRLVRAGLAVLLLVAAGVLGFGSIGGIVLLVLAAMMAVTSATAVCPLYGPLKINTRR